MRIAALLTSITILLATAPALAQTPAIPGLSPQAQVELSADSLSWESEGIAVAEGNVRLRSGTTRIAGARVRYDTKNGIATFDGGLTFVDGTQVARAQSGRFDLNTGEGTLESVALFDKEAPPDPEEAFPLDEHQLELLGRNQLALRAERVERETDGSWVATDPLVTTCDCGDRPPDWTIGASKAVVDPGERVNVTWPVLKARGVPIAAFPYFSLPLSDRKTGLLVPDVSLGGRRGFSWEQPLFLVLGRSYDATVTAGWFAGNETTAVDDPDEKRSFEGPRVTGEFRYVPRVGTVGRAYASWGWDQSDRPTIPTDRWATQLDQADRWGYGLDDRISLSLVSDRDYIRDFTDDVVLRGNQVLTSTAWFAKRTGPTLLALEGTYLQDLRPIVPRDVVPQPAPIEEPSSLWGEGRRNTFARLPAATFDVARMPLPGNLGLSLGLSTARFAPLTSTGFGDEGTDGVAPGDLDYRGPDLDGSENNGILDEGERRALTRFAFRPTLSLPLVAAPWISVEPYAGWRQQLYLYDADRDGRAAWGVLGAKAYTEIARDFGTVRHAWIPRLEIRRLIPGDSHDAPLRPYDELDARPVRAYTEGRAALGTRLDLRGEKGSRTVLEASVGQDLLLAPELRAAESFVDLSVASSPFRADGLLRWDNQRSMISEVAANAAIGDERGDELRVGYRNLAEGGSLRLRAGPDELFAGPAAIEVVPGATVTAIDQIGGGATVVPVRGLTLRYDLLYLILLGAGQDDESHLLQQRFGVAYASSCDCWSVGLDVTLRRNESTIWTPALDLGGLVRF